MNPKSAKDSLLEFIFQANDHTIHVKVVPMFAHITIHKAFSYVTSHKENAVITNIIVAVLDCIRVQIIIPINTKVKNQ
ncbi:MAG: hypothetical protein Q8S84_05200 [bacterium]|nr:hypothetical protein [bacterium]MDP3380890.1 hypothetical protein [bacterium]